MKVITVWPGGCEYTWHESKAGAVFYLTIHGLKYPAELRNNPPRVRLLEPGERGAPSRCELLDEWPDAPEYWPESSKPAEVTT